MPEWQWRLCGPTVSARSEWRHARRIGEPGHNGHRLAQALSENLIQIIRAAQDCKFADIHTAPIWLCKAAGCIECWPDSLRVSLMWGATSLLKAASSHGRCLPHIFNPQAPAGQRRVKPLPSLAATGPAYHSSSACLEAVEAADVPPEGVDRVDDGAVVP